MKKKYKIISDKKLYSGWYDLFEIIFKHKKHDESWSSEINREVLSGAQVSAVLPYDPKTKKIVLIDQFRVGVINTNQNPILKEIVGGLIDKGEKPEQAAIRECEEEINCKVKKLNKIFSYFPAPGYSYSKYHLFLAEVDSFIGNRITGCKNENEDILAKCYSLKQVKKLLEDKKILNATTIIALQWFFLNFKKYY